MGLEEEESKSPIIASIQILGNAANKIIIDGKYEVVKRFGDSAEPNKMVFRVKDQASLEETVLKLFTRGEQQEFLAEV